ncbi:YolD-like family protein [Aureibacillus halotolerans]|uniref:YolD-like protein n=1 Tax=Aureibacillus halotolerans TaxID=1508390 RepID=A0A4R6TYN8_9BACI|nr:YolD-like family protein [Aureibacillus halotolerans]TDQ38711.1 YolD-like protein [Aureibacillus halotolerans]
MTEKLDRDNLLWEGSRMFLPEHKRALLEHRAQQQRPNPPQPTDEQQLEEWNYMLAEAEATGNLLHFTVFEHGYFSVQEGLVTKPVQDGSIRCQSKKGEPFSIKVAKLVKLDWA